MVQSEHSVRVRFAPSPTGPFHAGSARTVLYNWLFARHHGGTMILRIEDTDRTRYSAEAEADLIQGILWLGLDWDEGPRVGGAYGPYVQSQRTEIYRQYTQILLERGRAYKCFCTAERLERVRREQERRKEDVGYDRFCRNLSSEEVTAKEASGQPYVVRLKMPLEGTTVVDDRIRGEIAFENALMEDIVLLKSDGYPTYHLANVVDDHLMGISHVMRGDEWIPSTPLHVVMYDAFGWEPPVFAHLPIILSPTGKGKMSKRKIAGEDGQECPVMVREFREAGYLPEAMVNYLARVGWAYDDKTELFAREELIEKFSLKGISSSPAAFSYDKLLWMNGVYIRQLTPEELIQRCLPFLQEAGLVPDPCPPETFAYVARVVPLFQERIRTLCDIVDASAYFFTEQVDYPDPTMLVPKKLEAEEARRGLEQARQRLAQPLQFDEQVLEVTLRALADELGWKAGQLFMALRVAVTGGKVSPGIFETLSVLGRQRCLERIDGAIAALRHLESA